MISVEEALQLVVQHANRGKAITLATENALGYVLAAKTEARIDMPPFRQSAMDGYALNGNSQIKNYKLIGEVKAGDAVDFVLKEGEAVRIFTGAAVPDTGNTVVMQEKVIRVDDTQIVLEDFPILHSNIRPLGEQCHTGDLVLDKQTYLNPAALSYLISVGVKEVIVYQKPKVAVVVTGSELIAIDEDYQKGKIYESNSILLSSELQRLGVQTVEVLKVADNYKATRSILKDALEDFDVVLVSGGISVGDYDFVGKALASLGTQEIFYKIKQKPGKPLFFGKYLNSFVFGLPGNPASALTCFYMYVSPLIKSLMGFRDVNLKRKQLPISHDYTVKGIRAQFLKAKIVDNSVAVMSQQSSAMIAAFVEANAYIYIPEYSTEILKNQLVEVILLPQAF